MTHTLGVRAFGTQLLCEQVVGRGLRRMSYVLNDKGHFDPEYADVYGVPFSFIPCAGVPQEGEEKQAAQRPGRVRAVPERLIERPWLEVTFPRVVGCGEKRLRAELPEFDRTGSTTYVSYDTVKPVWKTDPAKCHLNFVPEDSKWETQLVEKVERMDEVCAYVKNQNLGFKVPYTFEGRPGNYYPDYILKIDDGRGADDLLHLIVEISGQELKEKEAKVETVKTLWVPAVNNEGDFGRWAFLELDDTAKAMQTIRKYLQSASGVA